MPRKSTIKNKNAFLQSREDNNLSRAMASELTGISESRIEKIESEKLQPYPEDILAMAAAYHNPGLCNYYCSQKCRIGQEHIPEIKDRPLAEIVLEMLASLNALNSQKDRLIEITADGRIENSELIDFVHIKQELQEISSTVDSLKLWVENTIVSGAIDKTQLEKLEQQSR